MGATTYSMKLDDMGRLVAVLQASAENIQSQLDALDENASRLRSEWSGTAATAYDDAHAQWSQTMSRLNLILDRAAGAAQGAVDRHLHARSEVESLWP